MPVSPRLPRRLLLVPLVLAVSGTGASARAQTSNPGAYTHFEARQTHPIGLTPDGNRLLALNSTEGRLSVFDVSNPANPSPVLLAEIPVGLEPVSLRARTNDEVWVVNELSDSVSVVSLSLGVTVATLAADDEPADVVFAQDRAFISCARNNLLRVFDTVTHQELTTISLNGMQPRALAVTPDGTKVFAAFQLSGNRTTTLPPALAPPPPAPANPALPPAPKTGLIVPADDPRVPYTVLDRDVAEISVAESRVVDYYADAGTNLFDLAVDPATGALWIANTDARNLTRFEPALRGHFVDNRVSRLVPPQGEVRHHDLNSGVDYARLPNPEAQAAALAQPTALAFAPDGLSLWVAAFGSDRVARVSTADGAVLARVDVRPDGDGSGKMRGPRGLALHPSRDRLYVLNKLSDTLTVIDTAAPAAAAVLAETAVASHDPMPPAVRAGRGFLFDARLSGNGTASCASCHLDADVDGMAWDLGDPGGALVTVTGRNNSIHDLTPRPRVMHPMKGPMTTQTLRGMQSHRIFHWRGDRPSLQSFNPTFRDLMGGELLADADIDALAAYLLSLRHHPNPHRQLDRTLPPAFAGGNPARGRDLFNDHPKSHCVTCHALPTGSDENIDLMAEVGSSQPLKTVPLRTVYQRAQFDGSPGATTVTGYGLLHDGTGFRLPRGHFYVLDTLDTLQELDDVTAFLMCFDTGTAPTVGFSRTLTQSNADAPETAARLAILESQAAAAACDAVARGRLAGQWRQFLYDPTTRNYRLGTNGDPGLTRTQLLSLLGPGDALTFLGVPPDQGRRLGTDRDGDGLVDSAEPSPAVSIDQAGRAPRLSWPEDFDDWTLESETSLSTEWQPATEPRTRHDGRWQLVFPPSGPTHFFRLRRTW
jgi:DNA-binding beta-propeller fold protein YncE